MKKLSSWVVYVPLQIAAVPLAALGAVLVAYRQIVMSRRLGASATAIEVFNGRWTLDMFGIRADPGAARLGPVLPNTSTFGLRLALFPLWVKAKIAGEPALYPRRVESARESIADLIPARTVYFDEILARQLPHMAQLVLMGAGMDTRAYGALDLGDVQVFELDRESTQDLKRNMLEAAGIDAGHVTFVPVDFAEDDLFVRLCEAGYDPDKKTLFLWEGVTLYLPEAAVRGTMQRVKAHAAAGSVLLADIYAESFISKGKRGAFEAALRYTGENFAFALPFADDWEGELCRFVESASLRVGQTFFMGSASKKGPFAVVVEILA